MKIIYATDLHGNPEFYEGFLRRAGKEKADAVVIGGDIGPVGFLELFVVAQREFLEVYLLPRLKRFREEAGKPVFIMMGNDDFRVNMDVLEKGERQGILKLLSQKSYRLGKFHIAGYSYINESPFLLKDWEREEEDIKSDLEKLAKRLEPGKTIFVFHAPPFNTKLDMLYNSSHAGSKAVREFIDKFQPLLTLHGHIHESPDVSGKFRERIGKTLCINPGNATGVLIDLEKPEEARLIKLA